MARVVVVGNATWDEVFRLPRLPRAGETLLAESCALEPGGKGLNQAIVAARAGLATHLLAAIGSDAAGEALAAALAAEGIAATLLRRPGASDRSIVQVLPDGGNAIVSSCAMCGSVRADEAVRFLDDVGADDVVLLQGNLSHDTTAAALAAARGAGAMTVLNTAPAVFAYDDLFATIDVLIANEVEAEQLVGSAAAAAALHRLRARGVATAIISLGAAGALASGALGEVRAAAPRVTAVDTAGAGDVLCGTLAAGLALRLAFADALGWAVRAASLSVTRAGTSTSFPSRSELAVLRGSSGPRAP
jgi:ribokinase